ncbi:MAG: FAD-binding oxidoreductase [Bacteroidota bacterium]
MSISTSSIEKDLKPIITGDVLCDDTSRNSYSTAACIYRIRPVAVVVPRTMEDVQTVVRYAFENQIPLIPRGGATSLAGQAVGFGIVLDCARYLNKILEVDVQNNWVKVEPGVVLERLNKHLSPSSKFFPPDPASASDCDIAGMIGTNATGAHGLRYGATKDYVLSLTTVLSSGELVEFAANSEDQKPREISSPAGNGNARYNTLRKLLVENKSLILSGYPKVKKNSSGYNLFDAVGSDRIDLTKILTGSEGTLGLIVGAKLRILDLPKARAEGLAYFRDHDSMAEAVLESLPLKPAAIELMDKTLLDLARGRNANVERFIEEEAQALLLFEFEAETPDQAAGQLDELRKLLPEKLRLAFTFRVNPENLGSLWEVRKAATHILEEVQSSTKKASFIEDVTVPVEALPRYLKGLASILHSHGISFSVYGHAGVGNVHCEPFLDLRRPEHRALLDVLSNEVFALAISLGGTLSGEHGDGYVRTPFLERLYGRELYNIFREVKEAFDPKGILNPGKIIGPQGVTIAHDLKID